MELHEVNYEVDKYIKSLHMKDKIDYWTRKELIEKIKYFIKSAYHIGLDDGRKERRDAAKEN